MAIEQSTDIKLPALDDQYTDISGRPTYAVLNITTSKSGGKLVSRAGVQFTGHGFTTTRLGQDYSCRVRITDRRGTQAAIDAQHADTLQDQQTIINEALAHYGVSVQRIEPEQRYTDLTLNNGTVAVFLGTDRFDRPVYELASGKRVVCVDYDGSALHSMSPEGEPDSPLKHELQRAAEA